MADVECWLCGREGVDGEGERCVACLGAGFMSLERVRFLGPDALVHYPDLAPTADTPLPMPEPSPVYPGPRVSAARHRAEDARTDVL